MAAGMMLTGGSVATAEQSAPAAGGQTEAAATVIAPAAKPAVTLPDAAPAADAKAPSLSIAPAAGALTVSLPQEEPAVEEGPSTEDRSERADQRSENRDERGAETRREERASRSTERRESADRDQENQQERKASEKASQEQETVSVAPGAGSSILATARRGIGVPYVYGGSTPSGWDCSGFTAWVYAQHGINLPHGASDQIAMGKRVSRSEARPGDLIYKPGHVGIYAGGNMMVDAGNRRVDTTERQIYSGNWSFYRIGG